MYKKKLNMQAVMPEQQKREKRVHCLTSASFAPEKKENDERVRLFDFSCCAIEKKSLYCVKSLII